MTVLEYVNHEFCDEDSMVADVAADVDDTDRVLNGMAIEIGAVSLGVLVVAAGAGWLLARRITRRLVRLAALTERVSERGTVDEDVPVDGGDEVGGDLGDRKMTAEIQTSIAHAVDTATTEADVEERRLSAEF